jgi:hypothetical protein
VEIGCRIGGNLVASRDLFLSIANPPVLGASDDGDAARLFPTLIDAFDSS